MELLCIMANTPERDTYAQNLTRKVDITLNHISNVLYLFESLEITTRRINRNKVNYQLTELGVKLAECALPFISEIKKVENEIK